MRFQGWSVNEFFKKFGGEVLCLIDHNRAQLPVAETVNQTAIELQQHPGFGPRRRRNAKVDEHIFIKVEHRETRIEEICSRKAIFDESIEDSLSKVVFPVQLLLS